MSKLYVFGIGGTGSRVLKAFTLLLASGLPIQTEEIIPMIIDTDVDNGDLMDCKNAIREYSRIHNSLYKNVSSGDSYPDHFFRTSIRTPKGLDISGRDYGTLSNMLNHGTMTHDELQESKYLLDLLFSKHQLEEMELEKGFLGNPNVGSVVLKNVIQSSDFKEFTQSFTPGDRIFIISSIFGGTGAAGFPLLLKLFRAANGDIQNDEFIKNAIIGAITVLPYFELDNEAFKNGESAIDSNTFISKTKAALEYYNKSVRNELDLLYYIGDSERSQYENFDGGVKQRNLSNFIELAAALSIFDFMEYKGNIRTREELDTPTQYAEFGIAEDTSNITLRHLTSDKLNVSMYMSRFIYFQLFITNFLDGAINNKNTAWKNDLKLTNDYHKRDFIKTLKQFSEKIYYYWLFALGDSKHRRRFTPFNLVVENEEEVTESLDSRGEFRDRKAIKIRTNQADLMELVHDFPVKKSRGGLKKLLGAKEVDFLEIFNNEAKKKDFEKEGPNKHLTFITLMVRGMKQFYKDRILDK
ncbi:MAG: hypothetical protein AAF696_21980 [Bacteroidota bacterium]